MFEANGDGLPLASSTPSTHNDESSSTIDDDNTTSKRRRRVSSNSCKKMNNNTLSNNVDKQTILLSLARDEILNAYQLLTKSKKRVILLEAVIDKNEKDFDAKNTISNKLINKYLTSNKRKKTKIARLKKQMRDDYTRADTILKASQLEENLESELNSANSKIEHLKLLNAQLLAKLNENQKSLYRAKLERNKIDEQLKNLTHQLNQQADEIVTWQLIQHENYISYERKCIDMQEIIDRQTEQLADDSNRLQAEIKERLETSIQENNRLRNEIECLNQNYRHKCTTFENERDELQSTNDRLQITCNDLIKNRSQLLATIDQSISIAQLNDAVNSFVDRMERKKIPLLPHFTENSIIDRVQSILSSVEQLQFQFNTNATDLKTRLNNEKTKRHKLQQSIKAQLNEAIRANNTIDRDLQNERSTTKSLQLGIDVMQTELIAGKNNLQIKIAENRLLSTQLTDAQSVLIKMCTILIEIERKFNPNNEVESFESLENSKLNNAVDQEMAIIADDLAQILIDIRDGDDPIAIAIGRIATTLSTQFEQHFQQQIEAKNAIRLITSELNQLKTSNQEEVGSKTLQCDDNEMLERESTMQRRIVDLQNWLSAEQLEKSDLQKQIDQITETVHDREKANAELQRQLNELDVIRCRLESTRQQSIRDTNSLLQTLQQQ